MEGKEKVSRPRSRRTSKCWGLKVGATGVVRMPIVFSELSKGIEKVECSIDMDHTHTHTHTGSSSFLHWHLLFLYFSRKNILKPVVLVEEESLSYECKRLL